MIAINKCLIENNNINKSICYIYDDIKILDINKYKFIFGSINDFIYLNNYIKNLPLNEQILIRQKYSFWDLKVSDFLPQIKTEYINYNNSYYKQVCMLDNYDIDNFCRSNSGCKLFSGQVLDNTLIKIIKSKLQSDDLLFLSKKKTIIDERRYWIYNNSIITSSSYSKPEDHMENILNNYVKKVCNLWEPDIYYVIDVGIVLPEYSCKIIEYNCWSTSGFYNCDLNKITQVVNV